ncbi:DNA polymerase I [Thermogemmatispora carboxidivorans]|uniref:DNA polymerase I n=1 Tax=Thermogemmatispora carboxidivorans TaxID=1382306 RepID=UPI00069C1D15|nr:DNA polymerase I [Thermogemmatispora carboxidivorans]
MSERDISRAQEKPRCGESSKKLLLVDGHALIHRAFHALPEMLTTSSGEAVNAVLGFASMLLKALADVQPDYVAVTFDRSARTFRHEALPTYKAQRPPLSPVMRAQFERIRELVQAFNFPVYELDGFEADDLLGTLARQATGQGLETIILTGDMDTLQLVDDCVRVMVAKRGISEVTVYDRAAVQTRYGIEPAQLPDFKGLVGDPSDNIPGVPGIGEKTASRLIATYGSLEAVLEHLAELKPKEQKALSETREQALQSKHLATIVRDAPVQLDLAACDIKRFNREKTLALFRSLEFHSLVDRLPAPGGTFGDTRGNDKAGSQKQALALAEGQPEPREPASAQRGDDAHDEQSAPLGLVPILEPPRPPHQLTQAGQPGSAVEFTSASQEPASRLPSQQRDHAHDQVEQLALFELPAQAEAEVRHLRLPAVGASLPLLEPVSEKTTSTLLITSEEALTVLVHSLRQAGAFAFDIETTSEDPWRAELVGLAFSMAPGEAYYLPLGHQRTLDGEEPPTQLPLRLALERLRPVLEDVYIAKYMHNAKYDLLVMARYGVRIQGLTFDTLLAAYLLDPGRRGLGLKEQVFQRLGYVMTPIAQLIGSGSKAISMAQVSAVRAAEYAGADADMTLRLAEPLRRELLRQGLWKLFERIEMPLVDVLIQMELHGVALDADFLRDFGERLNEQIRLLEQRIYDAVGHRFNINSTRQLAEVLFGELKLPTGRKTRTGYSVSAEVIESLKGLHPVVDVLLEYRQLTKLKSTYVDGLLALMDPVSGRVHTSFNQAVTSSGRLSSSNPNLQNIPVRTEIGRQIRRAFIADPSYLLLTADYSQIELRILARITGEKRLVEAFQQGEDIHTITAASLFHVPVSQVTPEQRRLAKTVVYAILYGQSAFGLAQVTGMSNAEANDFIKRYHETFPEVRRYVDATLNQVYKQGYVNTLFGRKRFLPDLRTLSGPERQALEREAINMPIQGTNADVIKIAMIRIHHALQERGLKARMILQVHDELVFEVPVEELEATRRLVRTIMEDIPEITEKVPLKVETKVGRNWYEAAPAE